MKYFTLFVILFGEISGSHDGVYEDVSGMLRRVV
jgi:hypothetical protein